MATWPRPKIMKNGIFTRPPTLPTKRPRAQNPSPPTHPRRIFSPRAVRWGRGAPPSTARQMALFQRFGGLAPSNNWPSAPNELQLMPKCALHVLAKRHFQCRGDSLGIGGHGGSHAPTFGQILAILGPNWPPLGPVGHRRPMNRAWGQNTFCWCLGKDIFNAPAIRWGCGGPQASTCPHFGHFEPGWWHFFALPAVLWTGLNLGFLICANKFSVTDNGITVRVMYQIQFHLSLPMELPVQ